MFMTMTGKMMLGNQGFSEDEDVGVTVYSRKMCNEFVADAFTMGYTVKGADGFAQAINAKGQIEGEWTITDGGMMTWSME